jgi:predicted Fe-Mo cluster-binding NifX family protein
MKIAVASQKPEASTVAVQAGRAPHYLIYDEGKNFMESISNPFAVGGGGAGFGVAKMLADKDVEIVIAGQFGDKMEQAMDGRGTKHLEFDGSVADALDAALG